MYAFDRGYESTAASRKEQLENGISNLKAILDERIAIAEKEDADNLNRMINAYNNHSGVSVH